MTPRQLTTSQDVGVQYWNLAGEARVIQRKLDKLVTIAVLTGDGELYNRGVAVISRQHAVLLTLSSFQPSDMIGGELSTQTVTTLTTTTPT